MLECMVSADLSIEDVDTAATTLVRSLGMPQWRQSWLHDWPELNYRAYFLRPQLNRALAPTAIEVIGPHPHGGWSAQLRALHLQQGDRPMKTHNTVFGVPDVRAYAERLRGKGVPFRFTPGTDELPFARMWVGITGEGDSIAYDPQYDAGLFIELVETASLRLPDDATQPSIEPGVNPGEVVRAESRTFIVDDLDATLTTVEELLGWNAPDITTSKLDNCRVATYKPTIPGTTYFELLEPLSDAGLVAEHRARFGPGAYRITFAVNGLDVASHALHDRDVRHQLDADEAESRIRIDPEQLGMIVDLVDFRSRAQVM